MKQLGRGLASAAVCALGVGSMYASGGKAGVGWAILGLLFIWGCQEANGE